ncbi:hypothetical protein PR048_023706 [Dryococelus australis]|uniref:Uncharacterized protein n=1 Tax=Dryococelus australis TaxID=614101 RepID=A0ABQ9GUV1_9NEOP|nr:hypothetical protein PR048_023706 [Dryococelus australis]
MLQFLKRIDEELINNVRSCLRSGTSRPALLASGALFPSANNFPLLRCLSKPRPGIGKWTVVTKVCTCYCNARVAEGGGVVLHGAREYAPVWEHALRTPALLWSDNLPSVDTPPPPRPSCATCNEGRRVAGAPHKTAYKSQMTHRIYNIQVDTCGPQGREITVKALDKCVLRHVQRAAVGPALIDLLGYPSAPNLKYRYALTALRCVPCPYNKRRSAWRPHACFKGEKPATTTAALGLQRSGLNFWSYLRINCSIVAVAPLGETRGVVNLLDQASEATRVGPGGVVVRLLAFHLGEQGSIPGRVAPGFCHVVVVLNDADGRRILSKISRLPPPPPPPDLHPFNLTVLHTHLASPTSALKTSIAGIKGRGWTGDPRENPQTIGIVRQDSHMRKSESDPAGNITQSLPLHAVWWEEADGEKKLRQERDESGPLGHGVVITGDAGAACNETPSHTKVSQRQLAKAEAARQLSTLLIEAIVRYANCVGVAISTPTLLFQAGSLHGFSRVESWRTMSLVGVFSRGSPVSPAHAFRRCSILNALHPRVAFTSTLHFNASIG